MAFKISFQAYVKNHVTTSIKNSINAKIISIYQTRKMLTEIAPKDSEFIIIKHAHRITYETYVGCGIEGKKYRY